MNKLDAFTIKFDYAGLPYEGLVFPVEAINKKAMPGRWHVILNGKFFGNLSKQCKGWISDTIRAQPITDVIGEFIYKYAKW